MRPSRGEPVLVWPGKRSSRDEPPAAPTLTTTESAGDDGDEKNLLLAGDNRGVMRALLPRWAGRVDLIYIDPPFGTGESYALSERAAGEGPGIEAYRDKWRLGLGDYLSTMIEQLALMRELLSERGTIFVHCDWHVSHYLRCLLDEVFGPSCFKNEIVWRYRRWPAKTRAFQRMHDVLFWYGKRDDDGHAWTPSYEPLAPSTQKTWGTKRQIADFSSGRRKPSQTDELSPGAPASDVWEIGIIAPIAHERVGYPTQKPEALLRRAIEATTRPGDVVADFFAGSGTTLVVAEKLGRRWIGCDVGAAALHATKKRLLALPGARFDVLREASLVRSDEGPRVEVTHARAGTSVELRLGGADVGSVDSWSVDWAHDGRVFRHRWAASRPTARGALPVAARFDGELLEESARKGRTIAVRATDVGGSQREIVLEVARALGA